MLSFQQLSLNIKEKEIFSNINITFFPSAFILLYGSNGCGKTSLLRVISNIQKPSYGKVIYNGLDIRELYKPYCLYIGHNVGIKEELTVLEHLKFWSKIYQSIETIEAAIYYFNLYDIINLKCYQLSIGNKQKVALSKLIICQTNLWLLDEVDVNLDLENKKLLYNLILSKIDNNGIVFFTTHSLIKIQRSQVMNLEDYKLA